LETALAHLEIGLLGAITIGVFCGVRVEELKKLEWPDIKDSGNDPIVTISGKTGSVRNRIFSDETDLRRHVFDYIEVFYNRFRKHSSLGYKTPIQFEREFFAPQGGQREERYLYQSQEN